VAGAAATALPVVASIPEDVALDPPALEPGPDASQPEQQASTPAGAAAPPNSVASPTRRALEVVDPRQFRVPAQPDADRLPVGLSNVAARPGPIAQPAAVPRKPGRP
jgi:hypothetical protein